jgi:hypothetical protein
LANLGFKLELTRSVNTDLLSTFQDQNDEFLLALFQESMDLIICSHFRKYEYDKSIMKYEEVEKEFQVCFVALGKFRW